MSPFSKKFDPQSDLPDLSGKVAIVTGGNAGIGYATVKHLARLGAKVYVAARSEEKLAATVERIQSDDDIDNDLIQPLLLDLADARKAKAAAEEFIEMEDRLDILRAYEQSVDAVAGSMMINHISPFVFTQTLLPLMKTTSEETDSDVRIVNVTSVMHKLPTPAQGRFRNLDDFNQDFAKTSMPMLLQYAYSKLANVVYTRELQRRLTCANTRIAVLAVHPGLVNTYAHRLALPSLLQPLASALMRAFLRRPAVGAYNSVWAAAAPDVKLKDLGGKYVEPIGKVVPPSKVALKEEVGQELWATTEEFLKSIGLELPAMST
ncbi:hypothetical protein HWV62_39011 [Athelia sp. TMB]|nr:hypothetical protein HWV62_39011 [Athelia sp. TMB]